VNDNRRFGGSSSLHHVYTYNSYLIQVLQTKSRDVTHLFSIYCLVTRREHFVSFSDWEGAHSGTELQAGWSRVRFLMGYLGFFIDIILPAVL
jgi:hypothetical protein